jgi:phosphoglycolate phosphatase-like HAD superfamily hydrolase
MGKKLILFDIDGVLIKEGTLLGRWSFAIKKIFDVDADINQIKASGKTDINILYELARTSGISESEVERHMNELLYALIEYVKNHIHETKIHTQDGVENLLKELKNRGYFLGLVTGNVEANAKIKLEKIKLYQFFDLGSFGDKFSTRSEIIEDVIKKAESKLRTNIDKNDVFYFGDSPLDVKAGKESGIKTIAVATGSYSKEDLQKTNPDFVFQDLSDFKKILNIIK